METVWMYRDIATPDMEVQMGYNGKVEVNAIWSKGEASDVAVGGEAGAVTGLRKCIAYCRAWHVTLEQCRGYGAK